MHDTQVFPRTYMSIFCFTYNRVLHLKNYIFAAYSVSPTLPLNCIVKEAGEVKIPLGAACSDIQLNYGKQPMSFPFGLSFQALVYIYLTLSIYSIDYA